MQIDGKLYNLGSFDDEADAARAFDRVARVLGRSLNFAGNDGVEVVGPRSEGADQLVADAVEAAKIFMDKRAAPAVDRANTSKAAKKNKVRERIPNDAKVVHTILGSTKPASLTIFKQTESSEYKGVCPKRDKWRPQIGVSQGIGNI